jgi:integrase
MEEVQAVLRATDDPFYRALFATAYYTGMRLGELQALRWQDIMFPPLEGGRGRVKVRLSWSRGSVTTTKSRRNRGVPMSSALAQVLAQHEITAEYTGPDDRVFTPARGEVGLRGPRAQDVQVGAVCGSGARDPSARHAGDVRYQPLVVWR